MNENQSLNEFLYDFSLLLEKEKEALIQNKGKEIQELILEKELFMNTLETMTLTEEEYQEVLPQLKKIRALQETNLLLTQQSIHFVDSFIESIQKEVQKKSNTYSKKGSYETPKDVSFFDQSL